MHEKQDKKADIARRQKRERFAAKDDARHHGGRRRLLVWGILAVAIAIAGVVGGLQLLQDGSDSLADGGIASEANAISSTPSNPAASEETALSDGTPPTASQVVAVAATRGHAVYPQVVEDEDDVVRVAIADLQSGAARHYTYMYGEQPIEFFLLESQDGVVRAAFNACDVCYGAKKGYVQSGDVMVCVNCGRRFASNRINVVQGGCNPAPLERRIEGEYLAIDVEDLVRGYRFF